MTLTAPEQSQPADEIIDKPIPRGEYINPATQMLINEMRKIRTAIEEQSERKEAPAPTLFRIQPEDITHV